MRYAIVEFQNGIFNCVYSGFNTDMEAHDHVDKLKASTYVKKAPFPITFQVVLTLPATFVP